MNTIEMSGSFRTDLGKKGSNQLRKSGNVPCVLYRKEGNVHFSVPEASFKNLVYTPEANLVKLNIEDKEFRVVLKDMQFHPVKDNILHADFMEVHDDKPVVISIPVKITGDSVGVIAGGKLVVKNRKLKVSALAEHLPEHLLVDITNLKINQSVRVGDLSYDNLTLLDSKKMLVLSIATSRVAQKSGAAGGEA